MSSLGSLGRSATGLVLAGLAVAPTAASLALAGSTLLIVDGQVMTTEAIPSLAPKDSAEWRLVVRAAQADDARFSVELSSDQFEIPIHENESTRQY